VIMFWILTLFVGRSAFAFAYIHLQSDVPWSLGYVPYRPDSLTAVSGSAGSP
jgi:hypothetical protein